MGKTRSDLIVWRHHGWLFLLAGVVTNILDTFLYFRLSPFGKLYTLDTLYYYMPQIYYAWYGVALLSLPFVVAALWRKKSSRLLYHVHAIILTLSIFMTQLDHETMRYMGVHVGVDFFLTYFADFGAHAPSILLTSLATDAGGAYWTLWLFIFAPIFALIAFIRIITNHNLKAQISLPSKQVS